MKIFLLFVVLYCPLTLFSQNKVVQWGPTPECSQKTADKDDIVACSSFITNGENDLGIAFNLNIIYGQFTDSGVYIVMNASFQNGLNESVIVDPLSWSIVHYKDEAHFKSGRPARSAIKAVHPNTAVSKITFETQMADILKTDHDIYEGTTVPTTTVPGATPYRTKTPWRVDPPRRGPPPKAAPLVDPDAAGNRRRGDAAQGQARGILYSALMANTVESKQSVSRLVYFERDKKAKYSLIRCRIGDVDYVFPFTG